MSHSEKDSSRCTRCLSLVTCLATFSLRGNECDHRVLVFPLLGQCLYDLEVRKKSMSTRMSAARQLLEALKSLHKAGIVHRGKWIALRSLVSF